MDIKFGYSNISVISDNEGNRYNYQNMTIVFAGKNPSVGEFDVQLLKNTKTNGEIAIKNVPETAKNITIKIRAYSYSQYEFLNESIDFRNVPIY